MGKGWNCRCGKYRRKRRIRAGSGSGGILWRPSRPCRCALCRAAAAAGSPLPNGDGSIRSWPGLRVLPGNSPPALPLCILLRRPCVGGDPAALPARVSVLVGDGKARRGLPGAELPKVRPMRWQPAWWSGKGWARSRRAERPAGIAGRFGFGRQGSCRRRLVAPAGFEPGHRSGRRGLYPGPEKQSAGKPARAMAEAALAVNLCCLARLSGLTRSAAGLLPGARPEPAGGNDGRAGLRHRQFAPGSGRAAAAAETMAKALGHWAPDAAFGEDDCPAPSGAAAPALAALCNLGIDLLCWAGQRNIAAALRHYDWHSAAALQLLGLHLPHN